MAAASGVSASVGEVVFQRDTAGAWSWTAPFAGLVLVELTGPGGNGGLGEFDGPGGASEPGFGGGGGGKAKKSVLVSAGQTLSGMVGAGGSGAPTTCALPAMRGNAGLSASGTSFIGAGGDASGGDVNLTGRGGGLLNSWDGGGAAEGAGDQRVPEAEGLAPGGGGPGFLFGSGRGANGRVVISRLG